MTTISVVVMKRVAESSREGQLNVRENGKKRKPARGSEKPRATKQRKESRIESTKRQGNALTHERKPEVKWTSPSTKGMDFGSVIRGYDKMTPLEKLKAKTRYLEQRYGAVAQLEQRPRQMEDWVDDDDSLQMPLFNNTKSPHEDAIFGALTSTTSATRDRAVTCGNNPVDKEETSKSLIAEHIVQSQKTTSWRERAAWLREKRKANGKTDLSS